MFFLKNFQFVFLVFSVLLKIDAADVQAQVTVPASLNSKLNGLDHKIDSYKNIVITLKTPSKGAVNQLKRVIKQKIRSSNQIAKSQKFFVVIFTVKVFPKTVLCIC